ncbi:MAG: ABC transporter ATP-binding protein [Spartobacteria bacterium]|nr:ABC transporter ATP-binding protein [Spartobacteria bacterium]
MITIQHLTKKFGDFEAVHNLNLHIPKGELFCFLGPNGAGKTTTIKMLCGLLRPTEGLITLNGVDMHADPLAARRITGYIPDQPFIYERLTAREFYEFTGELYDMSRNEVRDEYERSFALFGLQDYCDVLVKDLSHGLRQRLTYVSTLLHNPQIMFVDEPFVGLDPYSIRLIKDLLKKRTRQGMTIFLTTHILALAEAMADRIGIINKGQLVALGTLEQIADKFQGEDRLESVFLSLTADRDYSEAMP